MAVDLSRVTISQTGTYGPIEALTLPVLRDELAKLQGTLADDTMMNYENCTRISDGFIDELGSCINLSLKAYQEDTEIYDHVFDGLQEVINLLHRDQPDLLGSDGKPRLMDPQEARMSASDRLMEVMEDLALELARREVEPTGPGKIGGSESRKQKPKGSVSS